MTSETAPPPEASEPAANDQAEPSMEDILASIRKIIASDETPAVQAGDDDILELTEIASEEVAAALDTPELALAEPVVATDPFDIAINDSVDEALPPEAAEDKAMVDTTALVAAESAALTAQSFAALATELESQRIALPAHVDMGDSKQTLEQLVTQIMRPLLKEWLDAHLSTTVERLVQKEIERISKQHRD